MNVQIGAFCIGILSGIAFIAALLLLKVQVRCRHCQIKDQTIGAQSGVAAQMQKDSEYLKNLLDRALTKQGTIGVDPSNIPAPAPEDPGIAAEKEQIQRAVKSGGEAFGVDE